MRVLLTYLGVFCIVALGAFTATAQSDHNKAEVFLGYSYLSTDTGLSDVEDFEFDNRLGSHGFNGSVTGNVHRYVGVKFDFSTHSKSEGFVDGADNANVKFRTNQFLGGLQFKDNTRDGGRFKPFAHVLAGVANQKITANGTFTPIITGGGGGGGGSVAAGGTGPITFDESGSTNNFAMVIGAGLDIKASKHVDIRVGQIDYNPVWFKDQDFDDFSLAGRTQNNFRFSFGVVFH